MINTVFLTGRFRSIEIKELPNDKIFAEMKLEVQRPFKNKDGIFEREIIPVIMWNGVAKASSEYLKNDNLVGLKGYLQMKDNNKIEFVADKISFLSSSKCEA